MIKIHYICPICDSSTNEKVSGSVWDEPKTLDDARKVFPEQKCYYCDAQMDVGNWVDSSGGSFMCNEPTKNFDRLKPEFREKYIARLNKC